MVVSKRCKICTIIEPENMPITGEYFGRVIPEVIENIIGIELDRRKIVDVLICQQCTIQMVHTESVVKRLRKSMLRLAKSSPKITTKPHSKASMKKPSSTSKAKTHLGTSISDTQLTSNGKSVAFKKIFDETVQLEDITAAQNKKNVKRKLDDSEFIDAMIITNEQKSKRKQTPIVEDCVPNTIEESGDENNQTLEQSIAQSLLPDLNFSTTSQNDRPKKTKELNCVLCGKKFGEKSTLREHIETKHMGEKLKECPNCSMQFRSLQKYDSHVFGEKCKGTLHPCQFENCHRRFKNVFKMEAHMREKHLAVNEKEYV
ncbi:zinc finger protein indra isoform X1 [Stomoxys calcitrans]|uniref:zinc finger protein indra isoform X1 n=2 Tax=Stomoxys calcitrans TaxID=35570 RepID=UPI0027E22EBD|nr:zinc finger protein indra isoform X1 [Stomoxys calcitrans]